MMLQKVSLKPLINERSQVVHGVRVRGGACAAIVGDITPNCGISKQEKAKLEADAITDIQKMLGADTAVGVLRTLCNNCNASLQHFYHAAHSDRHACAHGLSNRT